MKGLMLITLVWAALSPQPGQAQNAIVPKMRCSLEVDSTPDINQDNPQHKVSQFDFEMPLVQSASGAKVASPNLILSADELSNAILGTGPLAESLKSGAILATGLYMSKNSQGNQLNNSSIQINTKGGRLQSTAIGLNQAQSIAKLSFENDTEVHDIKLTCATR